MERIYEESEEEKEQNILYEKMKLIIEWWAQAPPFEAYAHS